jgi:hypothetical protein
MAGEFADRERSGTSVSTVLMNRLLTEGVTVDMLNYCKTGLNLMAFIKQGNYMIILTLRSRCEQRLLRKAPNARINAAGIDETGIQVVG